jgi:hypothetical protein
LLIVYLPNFSVAACPGRTNALFIRGQIRKDLAPASLTLASAKEEKFCGSSASPDPIFLWLVVARGKDPARKSQRSGHE